MFIDLRTFFVAACTAVTLVSPNLARADEAALYDEPAPADAVFIRILTEYKLPFDQVFFAGSTLPLSEAVRDTYVAISAAALDDVTPGAFYSLSSSETGVVAIEEPARETVSKVHLILVNSSAEPVRLIVNGQGTEVVGALDPGQAGSRPVNPVKVALAVERVRDGVLLSTFDVDLARGQNLTFVANENTARLVENTFGPVLTLN